MGLKRRSRFAFAACLLGANAPDIDVFAPLAFPVDGIEFHRGPLHGVFAWPVLAAGIVAILWLLDRLRPAPPGALPFRAGPLFVVAFLAVLTHPFLDWLTTYAIALLAPADWRWSSGDAIFIVDWVYWVLMAAGIVWSARRWRDGESRPGRPAQIAGGLLAIYIAFNLALSAWVEQGTTTILKGRGIATQLVVASPPPFAFWRRTVSWRSSDLYGSGHFDFAQGLAVDPTAKALRLADPRLAALKARDPHVRAFLVWSRMPVVVFLEGHDYLTDQRFSTSGTGGFMEARMRRMARGSNFYIPLD